MRLEFSSIQPVQPAQPNTPNWDHLGGLIGPPPFTAEPPNYPPSETLLTADSLRSMLIEIGTGTTAANIALAEALAKLGVPITEANLLEGQAVLARMPGISPAVYALSRAIDLPPSTAIMQALSEVVDRQSTTNHIDLETLDILSLLPQPGTDSAPLSAFLANLFEKLGQSTENKLWNEPDSANTLSIYDSRSSLLDLAQTEAGGQTAKAADHHASFIEGQQLLNQVAVHKFDNTVPLYFAFPIALASREASCEVQVWMGKEQESANAIAADKEEYLRATVRINAERLGAIETTLVGMWSGRLCCTMSAVKPMSYRLLRKEAPSLARALCRLGWSVAPIEVIQRDRFSPLWLGGELLDNPRTRVDRRI
jgi:hypothetical protein